MGHSYTPGLKVASAAHVVRERRLPLAGDVLVKTGDHVQAADLVARTALPGDVTTLHVANLLGVDAADLMHSMLVKEGDRVAKDQVVARGGGFLGMFKSEVRSPLQGTVESVSRVTGQVLFRAEPQPIAVDAFIAGTIAEVFPREGVAVAAEATFIQGIFGIGGETRGPIRVLGSGPEQPLEAAALDAFLAGAVVVGGAYASLATIRRAIEVRAAALVVGGVSYASLTELLGRPIGVAVTGSETVGITLIVTEGFGRIPMARRTFELLSAAAGRLASVNGATQIRAGVMRPEIVIPRDAGASTAAAAASEPAGLEPGSAVRVIREPYFGILGRVAALPPELRPLATETHVRVAEVDLADGRRVVVPRSNLEILEA